MTGAQSHTGKRGNGCRGRRSRDVAGDSGCVLADEVALDICGQSSEPGRGAGREGLLDESRGSTRVGKGNSEDTAGQDGDQVGSSGGRVDLTLVQTLWSSRDGGGERNESSDDLHDDDVLLM